MENSLDDQLHGSVKTVLQDIRKPTKEQEIQQTKIILEEEKEDPPPKEKKVEEPRDPEPEISEALEDTIDNGSDIVIGIFDITQSNIFGQLGKKRRNRRLRTVYGESALDKLEKLKNEIDASSNNKVQQFPLREYTSDEYGILRLEKALNEYIADLPLSDQEKDLIKKPLMQIMRKRGGSIPPEIALLLGILQISGARAAELYML